MKQAALIQKLVEIILSIQCPHPLRVGINGVDASGKTMLANALAAYLRSRGRSIIQASIDGFHNPQSIRYQLGRDSSEGYYKDSFNNQSIINNLLKPLGQNGNRLYTEAVFNFKTDKDVILPVKQATQDTILIMDGVFLFRPELIDYFDLKVFLEADFNTIIERALIRDTDYLGSKESITDKYNARYIPGQKIYFESVNPKKLPIL